MTHIEQEIYHDGKALNDADYLLAAIRAWHEFTVNFGIDPPPVGKSLLTRTRNLHSWVENQTKKNNQ